MDLMAELDGRLLRIQVKTSTLKGTTSDGDARWTVAIATSGGNRSWTGTVEGARTLSLGGTKYSEFEVESGTPFEALIYGDGNSIRIAAIDLGECQSGQMDSTVNRAATPTEVRILSPPSTSRHALLRPKRQITIPKLLCEEADLAPGDRMKVRADGAGRVLFERIEGGARRRSEPKPVPLRGAVSSAR
jgi:bifunctional DNA-binding transcriptional regulator/antitoxin component of YhaV-PrlF toxin-antitoxin module